MLNPSRTASRPEYVTAYAGLSDYLQFVGSSGLKARREHQRFAASCGSEFWHCLPELGLTDLYKDTTASDTAKLQQFIDRTKNTFT